jgi:hypothetical protein
MESTSSVSSRHLRSRSPDAQRSYGICNFTGEIRSIHQDRHKKSETVSTNERCQRSQEKQSVHDIAVEIRSVAIVDSTDLSFSRVQSAPDQHWPARNVKGEIRSNTGFKPPDSTFARVRSSPGPISTVIESSHHEQTGSNSWGFLARRLRRSTEPVDQAWDAWTDWNADAISTAPTPGTEMEKDAETLDERRLGRHFTRGFSRSLARFS